MTAEPSVALVLSPREWATRLHRHAADHGGVHVKARILRAEEATAGGFDVLIVDDTTSFLSPRLVEQVHSNGSRLLGVFDEADFPEGRQRLIDLGVDEVIDASASSEDLVRVVATMQPPDTDEPMSMQPTTELSKGRLVVVGGPFGGTGSTEVAVGLAASRSSLGARTLLVDADDVAPSIAQRLGLPLVPNLRTAVDQSRNGVRPSVDSSRGFDVVCGIPNARDWLELRPEDVSGAIRDLSTSTEVVIVNVSAGIERLPGDGRFRLARRLISDADVVVGVGLPTPTGVTRLLEWVAEVRAINAHARFVLIVNRVPTGAFVKSEVAQEITRVFEPERIEFVPEDRRVRRAAWDGDLVRRGPFVRAVESVVSTVTT